MSLWLAFISLFILDLFGSVAAHAHKPSDSYLRLTVHEEAMQGQWDIALRDLDYAIGLDGNTDGEITWQETRSRHSAIASYALSRLEIRDHKSACWMHPTGHRIDHHSDGAYAVLDFSTRCPTTPTQLTINYGLLFDLDALHRGLLQVEHNGTTQTAVFSPERSNVKLNLLSSSPWREFFQFALEGVWHIWIGYDHILFLISLLLPAVLWWRDGQWNPVGYFGRACGEVLKIVTSFTLAHSVTLSLSALHLMTLPSRWVESIIAGSVVLAALHNLYPVMPIRRWIVAFGFGLIHGFGFASVLADLSLPTTSMLMTLAGFNFGVEFGQIGIVSLFLPLAFLLRRSWTYRILVLRLGSLGIAGLASLWMLERSLDRPFSSWLW
ncbi:MAG: HupE/UreJ family protein [Nitrospirales bacterium]|nr:HupE/UreJ family protein [Nitrospirales bacterium]